MKIIVWVFIYRLKMK